MCVETPGPPAEPDSSVIVLQTTRDWFLDDTFENGIKNEIVRSPWRELRAVQLSMVPLPPWMSPAGTLARDKYSDSRTPLATTIVASKTMKTGFHKQLCSRRLQLRHNRRLRRRPVDGDAIAKGCASDPKQASCDSEPPQEAVIATAADQFGTGATIRSSVKRLWGGRNVQKSNRWATSTLQPVYQSSFGRSKRAVRPTKLKGGHENYE